MKKPAKANQKEDMAQTAAATANDEKKSTSWKPTAIRFDAWVLAAAFGLAGAMKLLGPLLGIDYFEEKFVIDWGYGHTFLVLTGLAELAAAVLLLKPRTRYLGALAVVFIMIGAIITHKKFGDPGSAFISPVVFLIAAMFITWNARHIMPPREQDDESGEQTSEAATKD